MLLPAAKRPVYAAGLHVNVAAKQSLGKAAKELPGPSAKPSERIDWAVE